MFAKLLDAVKRVLYRMNIIKGIKSVWHEKNLPDYENFYQLIDEWKRIYQGHAPWLDINNRHGGRKMANLNVAKVLCREFASLVFSERVSITVSNDAYHDFVAGVLEDNGFTVHFSAALESMFALGGCVVDAYLDNGKVRLDYVSADCFAPSGWTPRRIEDGVTVSQTVRGGRYYTLLRTETRDIVNRDGIAMPGVQIDHRLYESRTARELGVEIPLARLYPQLPEHSEVAPTEAPLFVYFHPNTANHIDAGNPLGMSIYSHAIDTLRELDIAFDSFGREFILGRKRILIPSRAMREVTDPRTGKRARFFDANDEAYEFFYTDDAGDLKIYDNTVELRVEEHVAAINALLNILCFQTGLSAGSLSFDAAGGLKTATEVISQNSKTFRAKQDHQIVLGDGLKDLVDAIITLGCAAGEITAGAEYETTIDFDDSIILDRDKERAIWMEEMQAGVMRPEAYLMRRYHVTEAEAKAMLPQSSELVD